MACVAEGERLEALLHQRALYRAQVFVASRIRGKLGEGYKVEATREPACMHAEA